MDVTLEAKRKPLSALSVFSYIPPRRKEPKEMSYYNSVREFPEISLHDQIFHQAEGYDNKLHRDDRTHSKGRGLNIHKEEKSRAVPVRTSSEYGHRDCPAIYRPLQQYAHVAQIKAEVFMENGLIWTMEEGYGAVLPN
ncbi:hypothetical protein LDENG_00056870 [Lucifuga dentata]|nr:hypothetical protein LDENG_00056870 [Lucifuga dentata]